MKKVSKVFVVAAMLLFTAEANAQIKFDSIGLGQSYKEVMTFIDEDHSYRLKEKDTLQQHLVQFYDTRQNIVVDFFFDPVKMTLVRIHMEEPHHLTGRQEYRLMETNKELWAAELHPHEVLECYLENDVYVEEIIDEESDGVHHIKVQFPLDEKRMIVDVFMN